MNFLKESKHKISYKQVKNPKVSFISTIFNQEYYLSDFIFSIQNQKLKESELILVDDYSEDNSSKIIKKMEIKDKRIKLIRNKKNMGTLYSRYIGELNSNGEFFIFIDCDDIVMKKGIFNSYKYIKQNKIDIIQFHIIRQNENLIFINNFSNNYTKTIYEEYNYALWNKLIKREIVNKAFKWIGEKFLKEKILIHNDCIILFSLLRNANSYKYIDEIGYYYYYASNKDSASRFWKKFEKSNEIFHGLFANIKFLYERTDNSYLDKYFCIFKLKKDFMLANKLFKYLNGKELVFIIKILNKLISSDYILIGDKLVIITIKTLTYNFFII